MSDVDINTDSHFEGRDINLDSHLKAGLEYCMNIQICERSLTQHIQRLTLLVHTSALLHPR